MHARGQSFPDWIALRSGQIDTFPDGVAYPQTREDVQSLITYAKKAGLHLIPYGGGTSVVGTYQSSSWRGACRNGRYGRMNRLRNFDRESLLATFETGVRGPDLEAQLRARGCTLGHFPQSFELSTLGGWIATRSSGQQSLGYGRIEKLFAGGQLESPSGSLLYPILSLLLRLGLISGDHLGIGRTFRNPHRGDRKSQPAPRPGGFSWHIFPRLRKRPESSTENAARKPPTGYATLIYS
jgi:FAD/FMN-containing dehydrogenase